MRRRNVGKDGYESSSASDSNSSALSFWMTHKQQCSVSELVALVKSFLLPEPAPERPYVHPSQYTKPEHVRVYSDEMDKDYQPSPWTLAFAALTLGLYIGVPHILLSLLIFSCWSRAALVALLVLLGTLLLPAGPLRMQSALSSYLFLAWRRYFHFSFVFEEKLDCYKDYIIAQYPHGAFPLACLVGGSFMATEFPEYHCYAMAASSAFYVPIWRHVHAWLGTAPCTKNNFHKLLGLGVHGPLHHQQQKGHEQQKHASATSRAEPPGAASATGKDVVSGVAYGPAEVLHQKSLFSLSLASSITAGMRHHHSLSDADSSSEDSDCESFTGSHMSLSAISLGATDSARCRMDPYTGRRKIGVSVGLMVGGIAEMFMIRPDHERIKVKERKGF
eukprot:gene565-839_t